MDESPLLEKGAALDASPVHVVPQIRHERDPTKIPLNPLWAKAGYFRYLPGLLAIKKQETYFLLVGRHGWIEIKNPVNGIAVWPFLVLRFHVKTWDHPWDRGGGDWDRSHRAFSTTL